MPWYKRSKNMTSQWICTSKKCRRLYSGALVLFDFYSISARGGCKIKYYCTLKEKESHKTYNYIGFNKVVSMMTVGQTALKMKYIINFLCSFTVSKIAVWLTWCRFFWIENQTNQLFWHHAIYSCLPIQTIYTMLYGLFSFIHFTFPYISTGFHFKK